MKNAIKWLLSIALLFLWSQWLQAGSLDQIEETAEANFTYTVSSGTHIELLGSDTYMEISTWDQDEVAIRAVLQFKGKETSKMREFIDEFEEVVKAGIRNENSKLLIDARLDEPNKVQFGFKKVNLISIGYDDDALQISYYIKMPADNKLRIKNSYEDLIMRGQFTNEVEIIQYSADVEAETFSDLTLELKYGKAEFEEIDQVEGELYEQELAVVKLGTAWFNARYSELQIEGVDELRLDSYESKYELGQVNRLQGELKYGELNIDDLLQDAELDTYELDGTIVNANYLRFTSSKYSEFTLGTITTLDLDESYEDDITVRSLGKLRAMAKYAELMIDRLSQTLVLDGYECDVEIKTLTDQTELISIDGKYNELELDTGTIPFGISAKLKYGDVVYPQQKVNRRLYVKEDAQLEFDMESVEEEALLQIDLKGYEIEATIR